MLVHPLQCRVRYGRHPEKKNRRVPISTPLSETDGNREQAGEKTKAAPSPRENTDPFGGGLDVQVGQAGKTRGVGPIFRKMYNILKKQGVPTYSVLGNTYLSHRSNPQNRK